MLQHLREIAEEVKELKRQVTTNTSILQSLGGCGVTDISLSEDVNLPLTEVDQLQEIERRLATEVEFRNKLVCQIF